MKRLTILVSILALFVPVLALATVFMSNTNINSGQTVQGNVYLAGKDTLVAGTVTGDLLAASSTLVVSGTVENDAMLAGGNVDVSGTVMGDLRAAGGSVTVNGKVNGEAVLAGGQINIGPQAQISGDLMASGGTVTVDPAAKITGKVTINTGDKEKQAAQATAATSLTAMIPGIAFGILAILVAVLILGLVSKPSLQKIMNGGIDKKVFWKNLGMGFALLFLTPILAILFLITGLGYIVGIALLLSYFLMLLVGVVMGGVIFGGLLQSAFTKMDVVTFHWGWALGGVVLASLIGLVPIVGWIFSFVLFLLALGSVFRVKWAMMRQV